LKSPEGFVKAPPKPAEVRRQGRNIREAQTAERDAAAELFYQQLGGDMKEANRLRMRENAQPGYTESRARQLTDDRETRYRTRTAANERRLQRSIDYWGLPDKKPDAPAPAPAPEPTPTPQPEVRGRIMPGTPSNDGGFSGGDAQSRRRRVAPQRLSRALGGGELSRLLGA
jgi:hypothetical protein